MWHKPLTYEDGERVTLSVTQQTTPVWNTLGILTKRSDSNWDTEAAFDLVNYGGTISEATIALTLTGDDREDAATTHATVSVNAYETKPVSLHMSVKSPHLWDITDPYRYTAALITPQVRAAAVPIRVLSISALHHASYEIKKRNAETRVSALRFICG